MIMIGIFFVLVITAIIVIIVIIISVVLIIVIGVAVAVEGWCWLAKPARLCVAHVRVVQHPPLSPTTLLRGEGVAVVGLGFRGLGLRVEGQWGLVYLHLTLGHAWRPA